MRWCWWTTGIVWWTLAGALMAQETQTGVAAAPEVRSETAAAEAAEAATAAAETTEAENSAAETAAEEEAPSTAAEHLQPNIRRPPTSDREIKERIEAVKARLEELRQAVAETQPATQPATAPAETQIDGQPVSRIEILTRYLNELSDWQNSRGRIQALGEEDSVKKLSVWIADRQSLAKSYEERKVPRFQFEIAPERESAARQLSQYRDELEQLRTVQGQRDTQLENLPERRARLEQAVAASLERLNAYLQDLPGELDKAGSEGEREELLIRKAILEWQHSLDLLRVAAHGDRRTLLELQKQQDADRVAALEPLVSAIQGYRNRLEAHQAHAAVTKAREELEREDLKAYERVYWELYLAAHEGIVQAQKLAVDMLNRYPASELEHLETRVQNGMEYRQRFLDSLDRREGSQILSHYRGANERIEDSRLLLEELQRKLDKSYEEQRVAIQLKERIDYAIRSGRAALDAEIAGLSGDEMIDARKKQMELTSGPINTVREELASLESSQEELITRLTKATALLTRHLEGLGDFRDRLRRRYLIVAEANLFQYDYGAVLEELRQLRAGEGAAYERWSSRWTALRGDLAATRVTTYINIALLALLASWAGRRVRSRMRTLRAEFLDRRGSEEFESEELRELARVDTEEGGEEVPTPRERAHYLVLSVFGESAPWTFALGVILVTTLLFGVGGEALPVIGVLLGACFAGVLALSVLDALFDTARPLWRMVPCRTPTARYHRRWLRLLALVTWFTWPIVLALREVELFPQLRETFWIYAKLGIVIMALAYTLRRQYFQPSRRSHELRHWEFVVLRKLAPLLPLILAATILLQVMGYSPLTDYMMRGVVLTIIVLSADGFLRLLLSQWIHLQITRPAPETQAAEARPSESSPGSVHAIVLTLLQLTRFLLPYAVVFLLLPIWGVRLSEIMAVLRYPFFRAESPVTPLHVLGALIAIAVGVFASRTLRAFLYSQVFPKADHLDRGAQTAIATLSHYAVIAIAIYAAMKVIKLDFGALAVMFGTIGLGLGLGLQPLFVNFVSGLMILLERQVKVGDTIDVNGQLGEVKGISMRSTHVRSFDGIDLVIPNSEFISSQVTNWTMQDTVVRARVTVGASYSADPHLVKKILLGLAHTHPNVLVDPPPTVWFLDFADSALIFDLVCWFATPGARWGFMTEVRYDIMKEFKKHGIEIPFPQRTLSFLGGKPMPVEMYERPIGFDEPQEPEIEGQEAEREEKVEQS